MDPRYDKKLFLPTSKEEMVALGWDRPDIILFSADAYVDHPSFGAAVIGRTLQAQGYKVAIVPQPNWRDDLRDFKKFGSPRLFFGVSAGAMDSMVNHYTANRRLRHDDAYTPDGKHGMRPDYPTIVYSNILKNLYPEIPVVIGGIEASMRRLAHYDYWQDKLNQSVLIPSHADILSYGMGERTTIEIAERLNSGERIEDLNNILQTAVIVKQKPEENGIILNSYEECLQSKSKQAENFKIIETESNKWNGNILYQKYGDFYVKVNPMHPPLSQEEIDKYYDLPYTRLPHPRYKGKTIPAYEMIKHSVTMHRGCFGGCSFCTISAHQGKFISSRSEESIFNEVKKITQMADFKGYISDLGGPSANMYKMKGKDLEICKKCSKPSCLFPVKCKNLDNNHKNLIDIYNKIDKVKGIKKTFIGSGIRYDLAMSPSGSEKIDKINDDYLQLLIGKHVSGRLKVAPEHTSDDVLKMMRKPSFSLFKEFNRKFDSINSKNNSRQQLIPYFISSHPGCTNENMAELAAETKKLNFRLEQVQDFTPTPMTLSTEIFYTGIDPYTNKKVYCAKTPGEKSEQRSFFFWYKNEMKDSLYHSLLKMNRPDLMKQIMAGYKPLQKKLNNKTKHNQRR